MYECIFNYQVNGKATCLLDGGLIDEICY